MVSPQFELFDEVQEVSKIRKLIEIPKELKIVNSDTTFFPPVSMKYNHSILFD